MAEDEEASETGSRCFQEIVKVLMDEAECFGGCDNREAVAKGERGVDVGDAETFEVVKDVLGDVKIYGD